MKQTWTTRDFRLQSGDVLPELTLAYESYGQLAPGGRNAVLVTHGFTSSQHAAGKYDPSDEAAGWWDGLIGPGKAIDTNRYFVDRRPTCSARPTAPRRRPASIPRPGAATGRTSPTSPCATS